MRHDGLSPRGGDDAVRGRPTPPAGEPAAVGEREVPLPPGAEFAALHAWLDGDGEEMVVTTAQQAKQREVWRRINDDTARMRRISAPPFLEQKIMRALEAPTAETAAQPTVQAAAQPTTAVATPKGLAMPWPIAVGIALGSAALGAALMAILG